MTTASWPCPCRNWSHWSWDIHKAGFQVCIHANGDATIDMVLNAYQKAQDAFPREDTRHRIEHCTVVNPDILRRMKALGCVATPFCTYVFHHGRRCNSTESGGCNGCSRSVRSWTME